MDRVCGTYRKGQVELDMPVPWEEGMGVLVIPQAPRMHTQRKANRAGHVIIGGYGLAGHFVAEVLGQRGIDYVIVDTNPKRVEPAVKLGAKAFQGDLCDESSFRQAGIESASILALTMPDEEAVLCSTRLARKLNPDIYIISRTFYTGAGGEAARLGADVVIEAEYAVAVQFYHAILAQLPPGDSAKPKNS